MTSSPLLPGPVLKNAVFDGYHHYDYWYTDHHDAVPGTGTRYSSFRRVGAELDRAQVPAKVDLLPFLDAIRAMWPGDALQVGPWLGQVAFGTVRPLQRERHLPRRTHLRSSASRGSWSAAQSAAVNAGPRRLESSRAQRRGAQILKPFTHPKLNAHAPNPSPWLCMRAERCCCDTVQTAARSTGDISSPLTSNAATATLLAATATAVLLSLCSWV